MVIRTTLIGALVLVGGAYAQAAREVPGGVRAAPGGAVAGRRGWHAGPRREERAVFSRYRDRIDAGAAGWQSHQAVEHGAACTAIPKAARGGSSRCNNLNGLLAARMPIYRRSRSSTIRWRA